MKLLTKAIATAFICAAPVAWAQQSGTAASPAAQAPGAASSPNVAGTQDRPTTNVFEGAAMAFGQADAETVRQVQQALKDRGGYSGPVDGVMNADLQSALRQFQREHNIDPGQLNQQTLDALQVQPSAGAGAASLKQDAKQASESSGGRGAEPGRPPSGPSAEQPTGALTPGLGGGNPSRMTEDKSTATGKTK